MKTSYKRLTFACYATNISMSVISNLPPLLFLTFRNQYGLSFSLLGLLIVFNFVTQLLVDLLFSFFSHKFNIPGVVKITPALTVVGLVIYAVWPWLFPDSVYLGLIIGTIIFSASSGLSEVLISPVIASIPSDDPDRQMSKLHSIYAWGVVFVILITTVFLLFVDSKYWQFLVLLTNIVPITALILFSGVKIPEMKTPERVSGVLLFMKSKSLWLCVAAIFLGGATECTMAQWCSGYLEHALGIPKIYGDLFGVAMFAVTLGIGRSMYAKTGKNIGKVLLLGGIGASVCYLTAALSPSGIVALLACALTGLCASMLWPGCLIVAADRFPAGGVFIYAIMAAGGDLGASVGPQLIGLITDATITSPAIISLSGTFGISADQLGMKVGMLIGALFPLVSIPIYYHIRKTRKRQRLES